MRYEPQETIQPQDSGVDTPDCVVVPTCCGLIVMLRSDLEGSSARPLKDMDRKAADGERRSASGSRTATPVHALGADAVLALLDVDQARGLGSGEANARLQRHGPNEIQKKEPIGLLTLLLRQFISPVIWLLIAAAVVATIFGEVSDAIAIGVVLVLNASIGFVTEYRARRSMDAIRTLGQTRSRVLRDGRQQTVGSRDLVAGDIVLLSAGNVVPADVRVIELTSLQASEAALTGESVPVEKQVAAVPASAPLGDRASMLFKGTAVTRGDCSGVVTATGMDTELGHVTRLMMGTPDAPSPLERQLQSLGGQLLWLTIVLCALITAIGMLAGRETFLMIHAGIALAVAAIPEGLPIVATVALAGGIWRMAQRNALVERMAAVETLGSTTVIFTDKTGTLTENRLAAAEVWLASGRSSLPVRGDSVGLRELLETGVLCNHAKLSTEGEGTGDPLELALLHAARDQGIDVKKLRDGWRQTAERPFDSAVKMMLTAHRSDGEARLFCKGAPERLIELACSNLTADGDTVAMTADMRGEWSRRADEMAASGLRVLALARSVDGDGKGSVEDVGDLVLLGLVGFQDPPRHDVEEAIQACQDAGIRVVMVTGDHIATATAISRQVGIESQTATGIDGARLDQLLQSHDGGQLELREANVFARVTPEHKLRLVEQLQAAGEIVAMTGDGVNDAPALRQADIGVAMGKRGTDVAREAADMVLLDDSFPTIVAAIAQGRIIFENIRRFVVYLLSCNLSEVLVVALAILFGLPMALLPLQILFLNLVTDVFPAFALAAGRGDPDILKRRPRPPSEQLIGAPEWSVIIRYGLTITAVTLIALVVAVRGLGLDAAEATTVSFLTIAVAQLLHVFNMRKPGSSFFVNDITRNRWVWAALGLCGLLLALGVYVPWAAAALQLTPPTPSAWLLIIGLGITPVIAARLFEAFKMKNSRIIVANT